MTDHINLQQLRARTQDEWQHSIHPELKFTDSIDIPIDDLLALIDAVQAAQRFHDVTPDSFSETHIEASDRLRQALNRFDHT